MGQPNPRKVTERKPKSGFIPRQRNNNKVLIFQYTAYGTLCVCVCSANGFSF